jgi:anti-sigma regulatory factor (Ser/Thr protein kinase)
MNVVRHGAADSGTARVLGSARDRKVQVWIEDKGLMVESPCGGRRQMEDDYFGGYSGMGMMLATCDHVYLYTGTDGTTVVLEVEDPPLAPSAETG